MTPLITNPTADDDEFPVVYWKKRFDVRHPSPHPVIATLDIEYNELAKAWKRLQELLPLSDQVPFEERPQTAQDVQALVRDIQADWKSSQQQRLYSRSTVLCDVFSVTVDAHTKLLTALPGHHFYSSLLYGTLQSIIKASSGYPRVINGVMKALTKVNQSIYLDPERDQQQHLTNDSIPSIADFYSQVFFFLGELMDWYARRLKCRLLQSHHEDVYLDFRNLVSTVRNTARGFMHNSVSVDGQNESDGEQSDALMQNADLYLWEHARLSQIGRRNIDRRFAAQNALTRLLIWEIQRSAEERSHLREQRGHLLLQMSTAASQQLQPDGERDSCVVCLTTAPGQDLLIPATPSEKHRHKYSRVELQAASAHLQEHFNHADQLPIYDAGTKITVDANVVEILKQWATDTYSQVLAIGSFSNTTGDTHFPSRAAQISSCYASLAAETNAPIITFFCSPRPASKDAMTEFQQGLVALVYSLIRQLLEYLPPVLNGSATHTVKADNFTLLDGTLTSWKEILSLIDTLLYYAPPLLMCIIDGLDRLSHPSTDEYIRSLVRIFVSHTRNPDNSSPGRQSILLKILFTVEGELEVLFQTLAENPLTLTESNAIERSAPPTPLISDVEGDVSVEIAVDS
ncbi:hypothetical protein BDW69DRAFT_18 [Aspergillus filifer]